jgi:hypothetical protein
VAYDTGEAGPREIERVDADGDGRQDLLVRTSGNGGEIHFLLNGGDGRLLLDQTFAVPFASGFDAGDLNGDGILDLVVTQSGPKALPDAFCGANPGTLVFLGTTDAGARFTFERCLAGAAPSHVLTDALIADFNGDGLADVAVSDDQLFSLRLYPGNGSGGFGTPVRAVTAAGTFAIVRVFGPLLALDVDYDGDLDIISRTGAPLGGNGGLGTFFNDGAGRFTFSNTAVPSTLFSRTGGILSFAVGDLNGDGLMDIVGVERGIAAAGATALNSLFVATGTGDGVSYVSAHAEPFPEGGAGSANIADFNRDGAADVLVVHDAPLTIVDGVRLSLGNGDGTLQTAASTPVGVEPYLAVSDDWNDDTWLDVAVVDRNANEQSRTWVLEQVPGPTDVTAPTVELTSPAPGSALEGTTTLVAAASDESGIEHVEFHHGAILIGQDTSSPYETAWDTTAVPNGSYLLTATAFDLSGNSTVSTTVEVSVSNPDTQPPSVSLTDPVAGSFLDGVVQLAAAADDNQGVTHVEFYAGATLLGTDATPPAPFMFTWRSNDVAAGPYDLTAKAYDAAGNSAVSPPIHVTVDRPPSADAGPAQTVEATSPAGAAVTLTGHGSDPDPGDVLSYRWSDGAALLGTTASITATFPLGTSVASVRVTDSYGRFAESAVTITVQDTTPPVLTVPADVTLEATSAAGAVARFDVSAGDLVDGPVPVECSPASGATLALGTHTVTCSARDAGLKSATAAFAITVQDTTPPTLTVPSDLQLEATSALGAVASFEASATDVVDGRVPVTCTPPSGAVLAIGVHTVTCSAYDADMRSVNATFPITVRDTTPPALIVPADITLEATGPSGAVADFTVSAIDAVDGPVPVACSPAAGVTLALGVHGVTCSAHDARLQTVTGTFTITVQDTHPPSVTLSPPPDPITGAITLSALASDAAGVAEVEFFAGQMSLGIDLAAPYAAVWDTTAMAQGASIVLRAVATDSAGLSAESAVTVVVDHPDAAPPKVAITSPAEGAVLSGTVLVEASASDDRAVSRVEFFADGVLIGTSPGPDYTVGWNTSGIADGTTVALSAVAVDSSGNRASAVIPVVVRHTQPQAPKITSASPPRVIPVGEPFTYQPSATGSGPLTWSLLHAPSGMFIDSQSGLVAWIPTAQQLRRSLAFGIRVSNEAGSSTRFFKVVVVDRVAPTPPTQLEGTAVGRSLVALRWDAASDNVGVQSYRVYRAVADREGSRWKLVLERKRETWAVVTASARATVQIYAVSSVDASRNESALSLPVEIRMRP